MITVGWREWVALPGLGVDAIKAKVDTGARTSALHAFDIREETRDGQPWLRFVVHPVQRHAQPSLICTAPLADRRPVRSSNGAVDERPVIRTPLILDGRTWMIELTLTNRDEMGFRLLLGRRALRRRCLVDPGRSYLASSASGPRPRSSQGPVPAPPDHGARR
ncbi:hypothetical protein EV659_102363 [Rhodothalassium salexigens DSM 2132]|uniref:Retropepsin-like aspartic endopeptidase domain-containing protein n=1 Tax=Rhodothalassium salexigens DSM 2132 TaxID=1188247 RepID=A0A4R2PQ86_RHOSA|nr:RimK/LysX family protein [Rhodothalassium salexigens]MBB4210491.1 hypothetical protein [Rhodothalassium salexigens DSM 2132]MBK1639441.1 ATP-dependent zinc protease [Rhodothalassium salexigens DSM 2132]TCP37952.1 hypothetical protein EV659_102363 [Rhodothalassium salexigens DSM 2132]